MLPQNVLVALLTACTVSALPLNINLGAYSPALVVGDGEISIGGAERPTDIRSTRERSTNQGATQGGEAAAAGAAPAAGTAGATTPGEAAGANAAVVENEASSDSDGPTTTITDANGNQVQSTDGATIIVPPSATAQSSANADANVANVIEQGLEPSSMIGLNPNNRRVNLAARTADDVEASSADGDLAAPAAAAPAKRDNDIIEMPHFSKRDIQGFRDALNFAMNAMKNTPEIALGTEAAGVGILQRPGTGVAAGTPSAGSSGAVAPAAAPAAPAKREEGAEAKKAGITLLAITEI